VAVNEGTGYLLFGHGRVEELNRAFGAGEPPPENVTIAPTGDWLIPVILGISLDPDTAKAYLVADNRLVELGGWNEEALANVLRTLAATGEEALLGTGYDGDDVDRLMQMILPLEGVDEEGAFDKLDRAEEIQAKWQVRSGDLWLIPSKGESDAHRLLCADATVSFAWDGLCAGREGKWVWIDPPYGVEYVGKTKDSLTINGDQRELIHALLVGSFQAADPHMENGCPVYVAHPGQAFDIFHAAFQASGWHFHQQLIWTKNVMVLGHSDYHYKHEGILYGWKGQGRYWYGGRDKVTVFEVDRPGRSAEHPTMKPISLIVTHLRNSSRKGEMGFDFFLGSGSTMVAAEQCGRICYGMDIEPKYCAVALERMEAMGLEPRRSG
jgi:hypothetical protein